MRRRGATFIVVSTLIATLGFMSGAAWGQASTPFETSPMSGAGLVRLNQGQEAYLRGDLDAARTAFEELRQAHPQNPAVLYFLGLIYLDDGLRVARQAEQVSREDVEERSRLQTAALTSYTRARECLEVVTRQADPSLVPVEALLDLGIAELASNDADPRRQEARELARRAAETLAAYVQTEIGRSDRYAYFFRAVALWRLFDLENRMDVLSEAEGELATARELAVAEQSAGKLSAEELAAFEARVFYYRGLIRLGRTDNEGAKSEFTEVIGRAEGTTLGNNAQDLLTSIERGGGGPPGIMLPGKIRFEGELSLGYSYDSNVILLGKDTLLPRRIPKKHDTGFSLGAGFDLGRVFTRQDGILGESLLAGVGFTTSHIWHPSIVEFDINYYNPRAYLNWEPVRDLFLGIQYDYSYTQLGHDPFISSNRITPVISKIWRPAADAAQREELGRTDLYYSYDYRDYKDRISDFRLDRDGKYHSFGVTQSFNLWKAGEIWRNYYDSTARQGEGVDRERPLSVYLGYVFREESTQGDEFDLYGNAVQYGFTLPLPWRLELAFRGEAGWDNYRNASLFDFRRNERFDFIQRYDVYLSRILVGRGEWSTLPSLRARLQGGVELTIQSNEIWDRLGEDIYKYDRSIYTVRLLVNF